MTSLHTHPTLRTFLSCLTHPSQIFSFPTHPSPLFFLAFPKMAPTLSDAFRSGVVASENRVKMSQTNEVRVMSLSIFWYLLLIDIST